MKIEFDHIGILVCDVMAGLESLPPEDWPIGEIETFPQEGTKEVYIGPASASGRLLLLEPIGEGPYRDALQKRGPGLHHIAINVDDVMAFTGRISGSGWYLHAKSLITFEKHHTVWLARPGVPLLIEVVQTNSAAESERAPFVSRIEAPLPENKPLLSSALGIDQFLPSPEPKVYLTIDGDRRLLEDLVAVSSKPPTDSL